MKKNNWLLTAVVSGLGIQMLNNKLFASSKEKLYKKSTDYENYRWKFGSISYRHEGTGHPILLIHDTFSGASSIEYDRIWHHLTKKYDVYSIDLLGFGFSDRMNITYTAYMYVQLIQDFIRQVIKRNHVDVITSGHSNLFVLLASQQELGLIRKCIMINPEDLRHSSMNPTHKDLSLKYVLETPYLGTSLYNLLHMQKNYYRQFSFIQNQPTLKSYAELFYMNAHYPDSNVRFTFASSFCNFLNININYILKNSNHSLYIIHGENRIADNKLITAQYENANPAIESATIKKTSDFPHLENPYATADLINLFLEE